KISIGNARKPVAGGSDACDTLPPPTRCRSDSISPDLGAKQLLPNILANVALRSLSSLLQYKECRARVNEREQAHIPFIALLTLGQDGAPVSTRLSHLQLCGLDS